MGVAVLSESARRRRVKFAQTLLIAAAQMALLAGCPPKQGTTADEYGSVSGRSWQPAYPRVAAPLLSRPTPIASAVIVGKSPAKVKLYRSHSHNLTLDPIRVELAPEQLDFAISVSGAHQHEKSWWEVLFAGLALATSIVVAGAAVAGVRWAKTGLVKQLRHSTTAKMQDAAADTLEAAMEAIARGGETYRKQDNPRTRALHRFRAQADRLRAFYPSDSVESKAIQIYSKEIRDMLKAGWAKPTEYPERTAGNVMRKLGPFVRGKITDPEQERMAIAVDREQSTVDELARAASESDRAERSPGHEENHTGATPGRGVNKKD